MVILLSRIYSNSSKYKDALENELMRINSKDQLFIATPFFTYNKFLYTLLKGTNKVKLIVRLCNSTSIDALKDVLNHENFEVRFFTESSFHSKIYKIGNGCIIIGSSNFTHNGLSANMELNIKLSSDDEDYEKLVDLCDFYWSKAKPLTREVVNEFENLISSTEFNLAMENEAELERKISQIESMESQKKELSELHKLRISEGNKGKKRGKLTPEQIRIMNEGAKRALSVAVVCLNNREEFSSMVDASLKMYGTARGNNYISDVCKGRKEHYKGDIWRFLDDYKQMTDDEVDQILTDFRNKHTPEIEASIKRKVILHGVVYDKIEDAGVKLFELGLLSKSKKVERPGRNLSSRIGHSEKINCPFVRFGSSESEYVYLFYADYEILSQGGVVISEEPVSKSVEELESYYTSMFDLELGDFTISDLLNSSKDKYYKMNDEYFKSRVHLEKVYAYDKKLTRKEVMALHGNKDYNFNWIFDMNEMLSSSKNSFYLVGNTIYWNKLDHINENIEEMTKEQVLFELDLLQ